MPRQLSDSAHCYLEYYTRRHLVTCHPRFSRMWWLDKYWGTGLKTSKWNLSFHDLMSTRSFVINHEQCSWKFDENTNYGDMRPIKNFYELWLWRFCDKTTVRIFWVHTNVHLNVQPQCSPQCSSQCSLQCSPQFTNISIHHPCLFSQPTWVKVNIFFNKT